MAQDRVHPTERPIGSSQVRPWEPYLNHPVFVALDVDDVDAAMQLALKVGPNLGGLKVGPRLVLRGGQKLISDLAKIAPVFVDMKFLDIPSTTVAAVRATFDAGATFATVHGWNGPDTLLELAELERELNLKRLFKILCVTILTSFNEKNLPPNLKPIPIGDHVISLVQMATQCGLTGIVASAQEVSEIKLRFPDLYVVTPGIRGPSDKKSNDQSRTLSAEAALAAGSNALVIGRPILNAQDPVAAALSYRSLVMGN